MIPVFWAVSEYETNNQFARCKESIRNVFKLRIKSIINLGETRIFSKGCKWVRWFQLMEENAWCRGRLRSGKWLLLVFAPMRLSSGKIWTNGWDYTTLGRINHCAQVPILVAINSSTQCRMRFQDTLGRHAKNPRKKTSGVPYCPCSRQCRAWLESLKWG